MIVVHMQLEDDRPIVELYEDFATISFGSGAVVFVGTVEQAEALRDSFQGLVDWFASEAINAVSQQEEHESAQEPAARRAEGVRG